ncbi:phosphoadenosine phosphosulfate reductase family protein, partial [Pseudomonas sp.]|uniref:phosphoadenosine phosphosulfate reductase domain-containing protein n=1 Tax=Pseudomonas sp. TaxID=306 RepID=UPI00261F0535
MNPLSRAIGVPLIVGFGGGVNSTAMLVGLYEKGIRPDVVVFADTGSEKPETYEYLDVVAAYLDRVGFPNLVRVKNASPIAGYESLEDECLQTEQLPSKAFGRSGCSFKWKIAPQEKYTSTLPGVAELWASGGRVIKTLGYDAGEIRRSSLEHDERYDYWYPLREWAWDRSACVAAILRAGLP